MSTTRNAVRGPYFTLHPSVNRCRTSTTQSAHALTRPHGPFEQGTCALRGAEQRRLEYDPPHARLRHDLSRRPRPVRPACPGGHSAFRGVARGLSKGGEKEGDWREGARRAGGPEA